MDEDLWRAMEEQASIDEVILPASVSDIMRHWTTKKNYPLITVERQYGGADGAFVKQVHFFFKLFLVL